MTTSRRKFIKNVGAGSALLTAGSLGAGSLVTSCNSGSGKSGFTPLRPESEIYIPDLPDKAIDGKPVRAALVGCGSRGTGAAFNFLDAADNVSIVALAEMFPDRLNSCRNLLSERKGVTVPDEKCFLGFDAYKQACDLPEVDVVLIASHSCFHPEHTKYAIDKGKHVFIEKPAAIDSVGYRTFMMSIRQAKAQGLNVMSGAQRHYQRSYVESYRMIQAGYIGKILSGVVTWNVGNENHISRRPEWTDTEFMLRTFFNWNWINGDQVNNLLIHWIDVFVWFSHLKPVQVSAYGSRVHRKAGNVYDNFSMDFEFENGARLYGMVRRMDGCHNVEGAIIQGEKGTWYSEDSSIIDLNGNLVWKYDNEAAREKYQNHNSFVLEHVDLINHIRKGTVIDTAEVLGISSMACTMARESAYSGKICTWDDLTVSGLDMMPAEFASGQFGNMDMKKYETVPLPGIG